MGVRREAAPGQAGRATSSPLQPPFSTVPQTPVCVGRERCRVAADLWPFMWGAFPDDNRSRWGLGSRFHFEFGEAHGRMQSHGAAQITGQPEEREKLFSCGGDRKNQPILLSSTTKPLRPHSCHALGVTAFDRFHTVLQEMLLNYLKHHSCHTCYSVTAFKAPQIACLFFTVSI